MNFHQYFIFHLQHLQASLLSLSLSFLFSPYLPIYQRYSQVNLLCGYTRHLGIPKASRKFREFRQ